MPITERKIDRKRHWGVWGLNRVLFPGNDNLTGPIPADASFQILKYDVGNRYVRCSYLPCKTDVALPPGAAPAPGVFPLAAPNAVLPPSQPCFYE
jgi:hypothetical protein